MRQYLENQSNGIKTDEIWSINAIDFAKSITLLCEVFKPVTNQDSFRILVEKKPEADRVIVTYLRE